MKPMFADHFGEVSRHYADSRPTYPPALFDWLAARCAARDRAWDCGTGSGQAALDLAGHFDHVVATDASAAQIAEAPPHPRIDYRVAPAEASGLDAGSVDLVVVAQALHWFDLDRFYAECHRVLKPGGVVAAWCYGMIELEGQGVDAIVQDFYHRVVGPYWPAERRHVESGYRDLPFPFRRIDPPPFAMRAEWRLDQLLGYLRSWSATARFIAANRHDPVAALGERLGPLWGGADEMRIVTWPLSMLAGTCGPRSCPGRMPAV